MSADICPLCDTSMQGDPIPQEYIDKGYYGDGVTHYSRKLGHEIQGVYDGILYWSCPNCLKAWSRWEGVAGLRQVAAVYVARHNAAVDGVA